MLGCESKDFDGGWCLQNKGEEAVCQAYPVVTIDNGHRLCEYTKTFVTYEDKNYDIESLKMTTGNFTTEFRYFKVENETNKYHLNITTDLYN